MRSLVDSESGETIFKIGSFPLPATKETGWRNVPKEEQSLPLLYVFAESSEGRDAWIKRLSKLGYNFFVKFHDSKGGPFALQVCTHFLSSPNGKIFPIVQ